MKQIRITTLLTALFTVIAGTGSSQAWPRSAAGYPCSVLTTGPQWAKAEALQWTLGYLSGRIDSTPFIPHRKFYGADAIAREMAEYCRRYPMSQISDAAEDFFR